MKDTHTRSILKAFTWRFIASATTMAIVYLMTKSIELTATAGAIDVVAKLTFYYLHERVWGNVKWGKIGVEPTFSK